MEKFPALYRQRGGSMQVSGYLAFALLALAIGEAAVINHLYHHRTIQINLSDLPFPGQVHVSDSPPSAPDSDYDAYVTHSFPARRPVCTFADTICYTRI